MCVTTTKAQDRLVVKTDAGGTTWYEDCDKKISSINKLPRVIKVDIDSLFKNTLGEFAAGLKFSHGQIVNVKRYFLKDDEQASSYQWVIPKYDLKFNLQDTTIGIINYSLQIQLDQYGQVLKINWPRRGYKFRSKFVKRDSIRDFVLAKAVALNFNQKDYEVNFYYDAHREQFYWQFLFPYDLLNKDDKQYDCISVNGADMTDVEVSKIRKTMLY